MLYPRLIILSLTLPCWCFTLLHRELVVHPCMRYGVHSVQLETEEWLKFLSFRKKIASASLAAGLRMMEFSQGCHSALVSAVVICSTNWQVLESELCHHCPLTITSQQWKISSLVVGELWRQIIRLAHHYLMQCGRGARSGIWSSYKEYEALLVIWFLTGCPWEMDAWLRRLQISFHLTYEKNSCSGFFSLQFCVITGFMKWIFKSIRSVISPL